MESHAYQAWGRPLTRAPNRDHYICAWWENWRFEVLCRICTRSSVLAEESRWKQKKGPSSFITKGCTVFQLIVRQKLCLRIDWHVAIVKLFKTKVLGPFSCLLQVIRHNFWIPLSLKELLHFHWRSFNIPPVTADYFHGIYLWSSYHGVHRWFV